ncbi:MAG: endonuclease NucS, partial [Sediminibacterium sp.]|nr:endonuclease NucS [Sediminibacterium sp.]
LLLQEETIAIKKKGEEELNAIRKDREELSKKIDERLEKLIGKTDDTNLRLNGLDKNIGYGIEEIFFDSINKTKQIGNIIYDECTQHVPIFKNLHNTNNAIDILLVNGKDVGIIEVKHRVGIKAVEQLLKTAELFKMNNNLKKYTLNLYVAGLSVHPSARKAINEHKIGFIKIRGEHFELVKNAI